MLSLFKNRSITGHNFQSDSLAWQLHSTSPFMSLPDTGVGAGGLPQLAVIGVGLAISATDRLVLLSAESRAI